MNNEPVNLFNNIKSKIAKKIRLCQLRHKAISERDLFYKDYDYLIHNLDYKLLYQYLYDILLNLNCTFVIRVTSEINMKLYIYISDGNPIVMDFWKEIQIKDPNDKYNCWQNINWENLQEYIIHTNDEYVINYHVSALIYITHVYTMRKQLDSKDVKYRINRYIKNTKKTNDTRLLKVNKLLEKFRDINKSNNNYNRYFKETYNLLTSTGIYQPRSSLYLHTYEYVINRIKIIKNLLSVNTKRLGIVLGADGSGKTTLLNNYLSSSNNKSICKLHFRELYKNTIYYKLVSYPLKYISMSHNKYDDGIFFLLAPYCLFQMYTIIFKNTEKLILVDRYFIDFFMPRINKIKNNYCPELSIISSTFLYITPKPDLIIQIYAGFEETYSRKAELSNDEWSIYYQLIERYIFNKKPTLLFNMNNNKNLINNLELFNSIMQKNVAN